MTFIGEIVEPNIKTPLYDSETLEDLVTIKTVDISKYFSHPKLTDLLLYTKSKRGAIVYLSQENVSIHYFYNEERGRKYIEEDEKRFGFGLGHFLKIILDNAPEA